MPNEVVVLRSEQLVALVMANLAAARMTASARGPLTLGDKELEELRDHAIKIIDMAKKEPAPQH